MDCDEVIAYKQQLLQVNQALHGCPEETEKYELLILKGNIEELLSLTNEGENSDIPSSSSKDPLSDEFALFMAEMEKEGAVERKGNEKINDKNLDDFKDIEGLKCRAPHTHRWGHVAYHNAMICSVVPESITDPDGIKVRVLFMNPTHREMLPCPYYYESDCKFSEERCDYSHGEVVWYSSLQEYVEPQFDLLVKGSFVLVKQPDNLWCRAVVKELSIEKCLVRLESSKKELEVTLEHIFPLNDEINESDCGSSDDDSNTKLDEEYVINTSLLLKPSDEILGAWEQYTKGIGSKLMQKMGYVVGTGLGKDCAGRVEPVTAVILPKGKSLDHCMQLREQAGGDKNFFSAEKRRKRQKKKRAVKIQNAMKQKKKKKTDMFNFLNEVIAKNNRKREKDELEEKKNIKMQCSRNLNIRNLLVADNIRRAEKDMEKLKEVVGNYPADNSNLYLKLKDKLVNRQDQLKMYKTEALMIRNELRYRENERKLTIF